MKVINLIILSVFLLLCSVGYPTGEETEIDCANPYSEFEPAQVKITKIEAESGTLQGNAKIYNDTAASGGKGIAKLNQTGNGFTLRNVPKANKIEIAYASGVTATTSVYINGSKAGVIKFTSIGAWTGAYDFASIDIDIPVGATFQIRDDGPDKGLNIDYINFISNNQSPFTTKIEAESGTLQGNAKIYSDTAASGGKGIAKLNQTGNGFTLRNVPKANKIEIAYASGVTATTSVYVNGSKAGVIKYTSIGTWTGAYDFASIDIDVPAGATFQIRDDGPDKGLNIDYVNFIDDDTDSSSPIVNTTSNNEFGTFFVGGNGASKPEFAMYIFDNDQPLHSDCYDNCETIWPPVLVSSPNNTIIDSGFPTTLFNKKFGISARCDGSLQLTYDQKPLYFYSGDTTAGETNGQNVDDVWFLINSKIPTCDDGIQNQGETGIDTGGPCGNENENDECAACGGDCNACGGTRTLWVDVKNGKDSNNGFSKANAFKTISKAASVVKGGDVMIIRPGVYYERPTFNNLGSSANNPVWILSETPGKAIISGLWKAADQGNVNWQSRGNGVYSAKHGDAYAGSFEKSFLFHYNTRSDLEKTSIQGIKKPPYGYAEEGGTFFLRLPGNVNPNGKSVKLTDQFSKPVISIKNSPFVILDGFVVQGAGNTQAIKIDVSSKNVVLRNLNITYSRYGSILPNNSLFEWSEYSYPNFRSFVDTLIDLNGGSSNDAIFDLVKKYFSKNSNAYLEGAIASGFANPSSNVEFRYNYIHEVFDGERLGEYNNSETHHNVYEYNYDDHIQFESWRPTHTARNLRAHDNLFLNSAATMLSHAQSGGGMQGPHYVYRNVIQVTDNKHGRPWTVIKSKGVKNKNIYYYHNTFDIGEAQFYWQDVDKFSFLNNILIFKKIRLVSGTPNSSNNNILVNNRDISQVKGNGGKYLGNNKSAAKINNLNAYNYGLLSGSPAINSGKKLPKNLLDSHQVNGAPDAGAFELGENPGNNWPRPRSTTYNSTKPRGWN